MKALFNGFLSLIYPRTCVACQKVLLAHEASVCQACVASLAITSLKESQILLNNVFAGRVPLEKSFFFCKLAIGNNAHAILHALKYNNEIGLGNQIGNWIFVALKNTDFFAGINLIVPNPIHEQKRKSRGYNQSELIAKEVSRLTQIPIDCTSVIKAVSSESQTRKNKIERWENIKEVYALRDIDVLRNKHILIIDDVITTGATIESLWKSIEDVEGIKISLLSFAYTV